MVSSKINIAPHTDDYHSGSAKRDTASGVAGLDASGFVLAKGSSIMLTRSAGNVMNIYERTSGEVAAYLTRVAATDYDMFIRESAGNTQVQTAAMKNIASGIAGLDASSQLARAQLFDLLRYGILNTIAWADVTSVQGTWAQGNDANQTDYDSLFVTQAGYIWNNPAGDLDEFKVSSLVLLAGTYEIKVVGQKAGTRGILEVLHGAVSLGTYDFYNAAAVFNNIATFTYSPTTRVSGDLRFRVNGKNPLSGQFGMTLSRIQIRKTA